MNASSEFGYVLYIEAAPERVWHALTDADLTGDYWGHRNVSDWTAGARWEHQRTDGSGVADVVGTVVTADPPRHLAMTFEDPAATEAARPPLVTFRIDPHGATSRLALTHEHLPTPADHAAAARGWPAVLSNLKSVLETGHVLSRAPWEMTDDL
ncbi:hypothetical protein G4X40_00170 [Rhodococcus sp. D2-41]|uniref:SRPBCC family protein n=1 Tax=Speluncibacter jeojiensis TaxID=2710754 RepID=UPI00240F090B|nr:SRPBCC family protein [Rhodococcus sp. D2-41]MDG3008566.1 hypothetical protein [Rhodococcus sp. D2-41]